MQEAEFTPTAERMAKGDLVAVQTERGGSEVRSYGHPLENYLCRDRISRRQYDAGLRYGQLWYHGMERSRFAMVRYARVPGGFDPEQQHAMAQAYANASKCIRGVKERHMVFKVCCVGEYMGRGMMPHLHSGLDDLAHHFGY
jgi:hypothetical protein